MTETEISGLFGRNQDAGKLSAALQLLLRAKLVTSAKDRETGGRPRVVWQAVS
jgi:hypothetical protein